jgi:hypothetical protein
MQAWREALVQDSETGFTDATQMGACRNNSTISSLQLTLQERGLRSLAVQCEGDFLAILPSFCCSGLMMAPSDNFDCNHPVSCCIAIALPKCALLKTTCNTCSGHRIPR